jgi:hypothetical protein
MKNKTNVVQIIPDIGVLHKIENRVSFDQYMEIAGKKGAPSVRDIAYSRIFLDREDQLSLTKVVTRSGILYSPHHFPLYMIDSPALDEPRKAINDNLEHLAEYQPDSPKELIEIGHQQLNINPMQRSHIFLPSKKLIRIDNRNLIDFFPKELVEKYSNVSSENIEDCVRETKSFIDANHAKIKDPIVKLALSVFKDVTLAHALYNQKDMYVKPVDFEYVDTQKPFIRQVFLDSLKNSSSIEGDFNMFDDYREGYFVKK